MKTVRIHQYGGLEALKVEDVPMPEPGEGEARVKLEAIGVNFIDIYHRLGRYQGNLPLTLGQEAAGTVDAVGPNVTDVKPGVASLMRACRVPMLNMQLLRCGGSFPSQPAWMRSERLLR